MSRKALLVTLLFVMTLIWVLPVGAQDTVTVQYWHTMSDPETEKLEDLIAVFEEANPGVEIEATRYAWGDFKDALLTSLAGGEAPDTARMDIIWVPQFAELGALEAMDELYEDFDALAEGFFEGPLSTVYWDGHYWGFPLNTNTQVLLYNAEQFEAAELDVPTTAAEFAEAACALTEGMERYGFAMGGTYFWAPAPLFYAMGGTITDADVTTADGYVNSEESVAAFQMMLDLNNEGCLSPNLMGGGIGTAEGHATGLYSMIIDGPWMVSIYAGDHPDFEVNFALVPGTEDYTSSVVGGEDLVLFAGAENQETALLWVDFLIGEEDSIGFKGFR